MVWPQTKHKTKQDHSQQAAVLLGLSQTLCTSYIFSSHDLKGDGLEMIVSLLRVEQDELMRTTQL